MGVVVVVAGVVHWGQPRSPRSRQAATPAFSSGSGPAVREVGTASNSEGPGPGGPAQERRSRDRSGAAAAALAYVRALGELVAMEEAEAVAAQGAMASTGAAEGLVADLRAKLASLHRAWPPGSLTYRVAPLAIRVVEESPDAMRAEVWYVGVVSGRNLAAYEEWVTEAYRLVWERDDWRVAAQASTPGPRPDPGRQAPDPPGQLDARLAGFAELRWHSSCPAPPPP